MLIFIHIKIWVFDVNFIKQFLIEASISFLSIFIIGLKKDFAWFGWMRSRLISLILYTKLFLWSIYISTSYSAIATVC